MHSDVREVLTRLLGEDAPVVDGLSERELTQLLDAVTAAKKAQARALTQASSEAMRQLPSVLRRGIITMLGR
jgi:hypothetical protein